MNHRASGRSSLLQFLRDLLAGRAPVLPGGRAWEALLQEAEKEGLIGLVYRRLHDLPQPPPAANLAGIKAAAMGQAALAMRLTHELVAILTEAGRRRLHTIPIRGPALAEQLHGDGLWRPMTDLDLLVRREDLSEVAAMLRQRGYQEVDRRPGFSRRYSHTLEFLRERDGITVEPHWTIAYPPYAGHIDMEAVWQRSTPCAVAGVESRRLSPSDLVLHLVFHLIHKRPEAPLLWQYELALLLGRYRDALDWPLMLRLAEESGQSGFFREQLDQIREVFDSAIPQAALAASAVGGSAPPSPPAPTGNRRPPLPVLLQGASMDGRESLALFFTIQGWPARLRYALGILFPSAAFMRRHYGLSESSWLGWYYLQRLAHLCREGLRGLRLVLAGPSPR